MSEYIVIVLLLLVAVLGVVLLSMVMKLGQRRQALSDEQLRQMLMEQTRELSIQLQIVREELLRTTREQMAENRTELNSRVEELRKEVVSNQAAQLRQILDTLNRNLLTTNEFQREKLEMMIGRQDQLIKSTEKRLDDMRLMVEEKLQKTLHERIGQSFELVRTQLENVQQGLG